MAYSDIQVPATVEVEADELLKGVLKIEGVLYLAEEALVFDYETKGAGLAAGGRHTLQFKPEDLREVVFKSGLGASQVVVRPKRKNGLALVDGVPRNKLVFEIDKAHRTQAAALVFPLSRAVARKAAQTMNSIPFQLPDINMGLTEITGGLYLEDDLLVFEVETGFLGEFEKEQQVIKIELAALKEVSFRKGVVKDQLWIRPKRNELLEVMPGDYQGVLKLKFWRNYRSEVEALVAAIEEQGVSV